LNIVGIEDPQFEWALWEVRFRNFGTITAHDLEPPFRVVWMHRVLLQASKNTRKSSLAGVIPSEDDVVLRKVLGTASAILREYPVFIYGLNT
jgi:hypothetical protein